MDSFSLYQPLFLRRALFIQNYLIREAKLSSPEPASAGKLFRKVMEFSLSQRNQLDEPCLSLLTGVRLV
jgi:hypothetical protein